MTADDPTGLHVDVLVVGTVPGGAGAGAAAAEPAPDAAAVDRRLGGGLAAALRSLGARGVEGEVVGVPTMGGLPARLVLAVGLGSGEGPERLRRAAGAAARTLTAPGQLPATVATTLTGGGEPAAVQAVAEGLLLGGYRFDSYRHASPSGAALTRALLAVPVAAGGAGIAAAAAVERAVVVADAVRLCRDLVNTPPNDLHPVDLAERAREAGTAVGLEVDVLDEHELAEGGYGGILGVGAGAAHPPRLTRVAYRHPDATAHVALVGKGITFDSGGLSLKPPASMPTMKSDMAGAATVLATLTALARLRPALNVTGWLPTAENMPDGGAIRPSDVLSMRGGRTVEVTNTDAEGRLVMADAIVRAGEERPDAILDVATLTGAQLIALGTLTFAVMGNDDALRGQVIAAAGRAGELGWPMPLPPELRASLDSDVADLKNTGERNGGMLVAGLFLADFVPPGTRWAHLDVAGPAFNDADPWGYTPKGGTGVPVRTLVELLSGWPG